MKGSKRIAFLLGVIFSFPLVYQSLHYFEHHLDEHHPPDTCANSHFSNTFDSCAICDYEMATGDQPDLYSPDQPAVQWCLIDFGFRHEFFPTQPKTHKSLRAPPGVS